MLHCRRPLISKTVLTGTGTGARRAACLGRITDPPLGYVSAIYGSTFSQRYRSAVSLVNNDQINQTEFGALFYCLLCPFTNDISGGANQFSLFGNTQKSSLFSPLCVDVFIPSV